MESSVISFSLFELNEHLKRVISLNLREAIWINCEIADVNSHRGNVYLSLVERDDYQIRAKADAVIWGRSMDHISKKIGDSLWSLLQIGRQVLVAVQVEFHEVHGMKLSIKDIDMSFTIGQLELKRMETLKNLQTEQFIELNSQVPTRLVWQRIAIVSSSTAAGLQDFLEQLQSNPHQYKFQYEVFQAAVQGVNMCDEVIMQLGKIDARKDDFDCVVIVRGGGARLDLMGFDDYDLCVAVATCELPVLTGIGHDIDETLVDLVAYQSLKTPTAVADHLIHRMLVFESNLMEYALEIKDLAIQRIHAAQTQLDLLQQQIKNSATLRLKTAEQELERISEKLHLLNPKTILERGFALVTDEKGQLVHHSADFVLNKEYTLHLADGKINVKVS